MIQKSATEYGMFVGFLGVDHSQKKQSADIHRFKRSVWIFPNRQEVKESLYQRSRISCDFLFEGIRCANSAQFSI